MSEEEHRIPIAEIFESPQGEGNFAGAATVFVRTAHCCVGKFTGHGEREVYETCTLWDGREFVCDTDYRAQEHLTIGEIAAAVPQNRIRVTFTGGEPLMWAERLRPLCEHLESRGNPISVETSGTRAIPHWMRDYWITLAPKIGCTDAAIWRADEIKFLVDDRFAPSEAAELVARADPGALVYLQPVNDIHDVNKMHLRRCLDLQKRFPEWRISTQMHKVWNVR